jgi:hypothetical protein
VQPLDCWDRGFESRLGCERSSRVCAVCCVGSGLWAELIVHIEKSYLMCGVCVCVFLIVCDLETSTTKLSR